MTTAQQSLATINSEIAKVSKTTGTLRERVQRTGILIIIHAINHGDWTKANDLVKALGDGVNGKALVSWFKDNLGLQIDAEKKEFSTWQGKEFALDHLENAKKVKWFQHKTSNPMVDEFDLEKALEALLKTAAQKQTKYLSELKEKGESKIVVNFDVMEKLRAIKAA